MVIYGSMPNRRSGYEFDYATRREALDTRPTCEVCGLPATKDDPFEANHIVAIWFALENPCLATEVIKSIANLQILHRSCHTKLHLQESRFYYQQLAPVVLAKYLESVVDITRDNWRKDPNHPINKGKKL